SQFNSIYSYFFAANSTESVHKFTFDGFNKTVKRNESTIGAKSSSGSAKTGGGDSGLKAGLNSVNKGFENKLIDVKDLVKCDLFDGEWVGDESYPLYKPGLCSLIDEQFNRYVIDRPDKGFQMLRWKSKACSLPSNILTVTSKARHPTEASSSNILWA
ncbi:trichome birefringence-like protein, partial [Tanacetum coccineum]